MPEPRVFCDWPDCEGVHPDSLVARVDERIYCAKCWVKAKRPMPKPSTPEQVQAAEAAMRQR